MDKIFEKKLCSRVNDQEYKISPKALMRRRIQFIIQFIQNMELEENYTELNKAMEMFIYADRFRRGDVIKWLNNNYMIKIEYSEYDEDNETVKRTITIDHRKK